MRKSFWRALVLGMFVVMSLGCLRAVDTRVGLPHDRATVRKGERLVHGLAACGSCHGATRDPNAPLTGGLVWYDSYGPVEAPNLTPINEGALLLPNRVIQVMRTGRTPEGGYVSQSAHEGYQWLSDDDLLAIVAYLRSQAPLGEQVERREIGAFKKNTIGLFESAYEVKGAVPSIAATSGRVYGGYLVRHVARCASCHHGESGMFSQGEELAGGKVIKLEQGVEIAPDLRGLLGRGWSTQSLVHYLRTGHTPQGEMVDSDYCPVEFFALSDENDLVSIATYLRDVR